MVDMKKRLAWNDYVRDRKLGEHTPPYRKSIAAHIIARRKERIKQMEAEYPDFAEAYEQEHNT